MTPFKGVGCDRCNLTGYKGRIGLYKVLEVTEELRELILVGASGLELRRKAIDEGMITLRAQRAAEGEGRHDHAGRSGQGDVKGRSQKLEVEKLEVRVREVGRIGHAWQPPNC